MELISNFNGLELLFIVILAILLFGPEKIPEIAAKAGSLIRNIQRISSEIMSDWREQSGLEEVARESKNLSTSLNQSVREMRNTIISDTQTKKENTASAAPDPPSPTVKNQTNLEEQLKALETQMEELRSQISKHKTGEQDGDDDR